MRSASDLRERWLDQLSSVLARPGMWARNGREMDTIAGMLLSNLCFVDDRDQEYEDTLEALRRYGKLGVHGPFEALFGEEQRCDAEVASVYAEHFHRLGYLTVEQAPATGDLRGRFENADVRRSEVEEMLGPASLVIDQRVLCYVSTDRGWTFFDCWSSSSRRYVPGEGTYELVSEVDPLVRNIRTPADTFQDGLILTLYGKVRRWGPGWWVNHPPDDLSDQSRAIAAQLRDIQASDPSQSLKREPEI